MRDDAYSLYTDGGARGNPGPAAIGGILKDPSGKLIDTFSVFIGSTTNNQAEYQALLYGLTKAREQGIGRLRCYLDSELVVRQMNFQYKVKDRALASLFAQINSLREVFLFITFSHVPRSRNAHADALVNKALDNHAP